MKTEKKISLIFSIFREELQSNNIPPESIPNVLDALQLVKKEQQQLIEILDDEQRQIEEELKQCKKTNRHFR